jgi:hypothetical protein
MQVEHRKKLLAVGLLLGLTALNSEASLTAYTAAGNQSVVYSSVSNLTWTGDANLLGTLEASNPNLINTIISTIGSVTDTPNLYDTPANSGSHTLSTADFGTGGYVSWFGAQAFTSYLNTINYAGSNQWALPSAGANPQAGSNQAGGQFGQLFYNELGGTAGGAIPNTANFTNEQAYAYWLGTEAALSPIYAWNFTTTNGIQGFTNKVGLVFAWAVSPGQVSAVPVPGAIWLFGTGLVGLLGLKQRRNIG